jgi:hypothetical protein
MHTSSQCPLSKQSYGAELDVNTKEPSPFQLKAASLFGQWSEEIT